MKSAATAFMDQWDTQYDAPFEMHDVIGQAPQKGGLLFARYGRGAFVYLAFAALSPLPEGVPGSYPIGWQLAEPAEKSAAHSESQVGRA